MKSCKAPQINLSAFLSTLKGRCCDVLKHFYSLKLNTVCCVFLKQQHCLEYCQPLVRQLSEELLIKARSGMDSPLVVIEWLR